MSGWQGEAGAGRAPSERATLLNLSLPATTMQPSHGWLQLLAEASQLRHAAAHGLGWQVLLALHAKPSLARMACRSWAESVAKPWAASY